LRKSLGKQVLQIAKPVYLPIQLTEEQQRILNTEPGDVAATKFTEMGLSNFIIVEEFYDDETPRPFDAGASCRRPA